MAEIPCMPFWTDAYLGDTNHLKTIEHGAYMLLLITAWRTKNGKLPDNDDLLARYTRLTKDKWRKIRPILEPFFDIENGEWIQGRLQDEREASLRFRKSQSTKAKARWLKNKETTNATAMPKDDPAYASPTPTPSPTHLNPPTPRKNGVLMNGVWEGSYKVQDLLNDDAWMDARAHAPSWDINNLAVVYNDGINSGKREHPKYPNKAFPVWCKKYTKGKVP